MGIKSIEKIRRIKLFFRDLCNVQAFVETGTYKADTSLWASSNFDQVYSIELSPDLYRQTSLKYRNYANINFLNGNSSEILPKIMAEISQPSIFWLDGHWSGDGTAGEENECPLLQEIEAINNFGYEKYIFIDNARLFLSPPPPPNNINHWPTIAEILKKIEQGVPDSYTIVYNDVIISIPSKYKDAFVRFLEKLNGLPAVRVKTHRSKICKPDSVDILSEKILWLMHDENVLECLKNKGLWDGYSPLRLHFGCGENRLSGYINFDFPPTEHTVQKKSVPDVYADITKLRLPEQSVDEIRLHHVFEHFERTQALSLLVQWHLWLKIGAKLHIETPDIIGCAEALTADRPYTDKQAILRHAFGSQEARWANHLDGWYAEKFQHVLSRFGFKTQCRKNRRTAWPYLTDVEAIAVKENHRNESELIKDAVEILKDSLVSDVASEQRMHKVWCNQLKHQLNNFDAQSKIEESKNQEKAPISERVETFHSDISNLIVVNDCPAADYLGYDDDQMAGNGELDFVSKIIKPSDVVFDVGANKGAWCEMLLGVNPEVTIFAFEPVLRAFKTLKKRLNKANVNSYNIAVSETEKEKIFYHYGQDQQVEEMSSFYRRSTIEKRMNLSPSPVSVQCVSLDSFCSNHGIPKINFLKIDTEGSELDVLQGAKSMLRSGKIDVVQFEYGGTFIDAGISMSRIFEFLTDLNYRLFRIVPKGLIYISKWRNELENYRYSNYAAIATETLTKCVNECIDDSRSNEAVCVIFSKDRAMQLDATISSLKLQCADLKNTPVKVIYKITNPINKEQYNELQLAYPEVEFIPEKNFKQDLIAAIRNYEFIVFSVDDNIFVRKFYLREFFDTLKKQVTAAGFSLRLGKNTQYCYMLNRYQQLPEFKSITDDFIAFNWVHAECDFAYPLELSSSIYRVKEIMPLLKKLNYKNPNHLESLLYENRLNYSEKMNILLCSNISIAFCNPINKVQNVCASNRSGNNPLHTSEKLSELFGEGFRIEVTELDSFIPNGCHQEVPLKMKKSDKNPIKVSIVIPCYNYGKYLQEAVDSVINQKFLDFEIIVVNDGSTDNTREIAEKLKNKFSTYRIRVLNQENSGHPAIARNKGIAIAKGEYILPLDADDKIAMTMIESCVTVLNNNPDVDFVYTDRKDFGIIDQIVQAREYDFSVLKYQNHISYCAMFRKRIWENVGGYRVTGFEDWDFWIAVGALGHKGYYLPKPLFRYRRHDAGKYQNDLQHEDCYRAQIVLNNPSVYTQNEILKSSMLLKAQRFIHKPVQGTYHISVIIPTYNRPKFLEEAIRSVCNQTYQNTEIIVVNDGGKDVSSLCAKFKNESIIYLVHDQNKGLAAARNSGIKAARGKYIALLDDDDLFYPEHLATAVKTLSKEIQIVYTDAVRATYDRVGDNYKLIKKNVPYSIDFDRNKLLIGNLSPVNCFVFEKNLGFKAGLFDETLSTLEDWDFWIRLSSLSIFKHISRPTVQVNWRSDGTTMTSLLGSEFKKNRQKIYNKYQHEISQIPNVKEILCEFQKIWTQDWNSKSPLTSIIVLTYNQLRYTKKCIESIFQNTQKPYELIIVDNGSTDGTIEFFESDAFSSHVGTRMKIIKNNENKGFAGGNNQGIAASSGEYILLMNNDVVVTPGWLERMISCCEKRPEIGIVGPRTNCVSGLQHVESVDYNVDSLEDLNRFSENFKTINAKKSTQMLRIVGFCMLIKRSVIDKIGGMDDRYGIGNFEDDDFSIRAALAGFESWMVEDCFVHHFGSRTFIGEKIDYGKTLHKNWNIFKDKWGLPADLPYGSSYSISQMKVNKFNPQVHYIPISDNNEKPVQNWIGDVTTVEQEYRTVCSSFDKENLEIAIERLQEFADKYKEFSKVYNDLGVFYYQNGNNESALKHYRKALNLDKNNISFRKNLADLLAVAFAEYEEALQHYVTVLASEPKDVEALFATGHICARLERYDDAAEFYEKVLEKEPNNSDAANWLAKMRERRSGNSIEGSLKGRYLTLLSEIDHKDFAGAIQKIENFIEMYPYYGQAHNDLGVLYYKNESKTKVLANYLKAVELEPENVTYRKNLADFLYVEEGRVEEALENYVEVLRIKPDDIETLLITGHICTAIERFDDAINFYDKVLNLEPKNLDAHQNMEALKKRQISMLNQKAMDEEKPDDDTEINQAEPQATIDEAPVVQDGVVEELINKADLLFQQERIDQAVDTMLKAIAVNPSDGRTYVELAGQLVNHGHHENAFEVLAEMPAKQPVAVAMQKMLVEGYAEEGMGNNAAAKKCCDGVLAREPENAKAVNLKGILNYRNGDKATAEQQFKRAIELDSEYGEPHTNLGALVWETSEPKMALEHYERGFSISPTEIDVANAYHEAVSATGEYKRAEKVARSAFKKYPQCRKVLYLLVDTLIRQEKNEKALNELENALSTLGIDEGLLDTALAFRERVGKIKKTGTSKKPSVSLCMIVKDEEANLARCLTSVKPIVDEIIVIDTGSTDRTMDIAEFFGAKVYEFEWNGNFAEARNFSLSKAKGDWILIMDADETISPQDYRRFRKLVTKKHSGHAAYSIITRNYCNMANTIGWIPNSGQYASEEAGLGWLSSEKVRLFSNNSQVKFEGAVHEMVDPVLKRLSVEMKKCSILVHHYGRLNADNLARKHQAYYEIGLKKLQKNGNEIGTVRELATQAAVLKRNSEAIDLWLKFLSMEPGEAAVAYAYVNMVSVYIRTQEYGKAIELARKAVKLAPQMKEAQYNLGITELYIGNVEAAFNIFKKLTECHPDFPPAQFLLAASNCCRNGATEAKINFRKIKQSAFGPTLTYSVTELAEGLMTAGQHKLAFRLIQNAIENEIVSKDILNLFSVCLKEINVTAISAGEMPQAVEVP